jgi:hypothetical protein
MNAADQAQLARWMTFCVAHPGCLPADVTVVQSRLIRAVGRGTLPGGGEVFLKVMGFPRRRDRLRYWLRALPAVHEAEMLRACAAAVVPCPQVLAAAATRTRLGSPRASVLATAGLLLLPGAEPRLSICSAVARALADAGILHPDLHEQNFVPLASGACAVLDLQSARRRSRPLTRAERIAVAGRLLAADWPQREMPGAVVEAGLIAAPDLLPALRLAVRTRADAVRRRVLRCMTDSTEFCVFHRQWGTLIQRRTLPAAGEWQRGGRDVIRAWIGARYAEVVEHEPSPLGALFLNSWWFPRRCSVYIAAADGVARFQERRSRWLDAYHRFKNMTGGGRRGPTLPTEAALPWTGRREV